MADYSLIDTPNGPRPEWWPEVKEVDKEEAIVLCALGVTVYHEFWNTEIGVAPPYHFPIIKDNGVPVFFDDGWDFHACYVKP